MIRSARRVKILPVLKTRAIKAIPTSPAAPVGRSWLLRLLKKSLTEFMAGQSLWIRTRESFRWSPQVFDAPETVLILNHGICGVCPGATLLTEFCGGNR